MINLQCSLTWNASLSSWGKWSWCLLCSTAGVLCSESPGLPSPNAQLLVLVWLVFVPLLSCLSVGSWSCPSGWWILAFNFAPNYSSSEDSSKIWYFSFLLIGKIETPQKCFLWDLGNVVLEPIILASSKNSRSNGKTASIIHMLLLQWDLCCALIRVKIVSGAGRDLCPEGGKVCGFGVPFP